MKWAQCGAACPVIGRVARDRFVCCHVVFREGPQPAMIRDPQGGIGE